MANPEESLPVGAYSALVTSTVLCLILPQPPLFQAEEFVLGSVMLLLSLVTFKQPSFEFFLALPYTPPDNQIRITCSIQTIALYSGRTMYFSIPNALLFGL